MDSATIIEPIKRHPLIVIGGVAAVLLVWQLRGSKATAPAAQGGSGVYAFAADPQLLQLDALKVQDAGATARASIQANAAASIYQTMAGVQLGTAGINADVSKTLGLANTQAHAEVATAQIGASILPQLAPYMLAAGQAAAPAPAAIQTTPATPATSAWKFGTFSDFTGANGAFVPEYTIGQDSPGTSATVTTTTTGGASAGPLGASQTILTNAATGAQSTIAGDTRVTQSSLAEMFDNVLRAGQGGGPLETIFSKFGLAADAAPAPTQVVIVQPTPLAAPAPAPAPAGAWADNATNIYTDYNLWMAGGRGQG